MFHVYFQIYKEKIFYILIFLFTFIWAVVSTFKSMSNVEKIVLLEVKSGVIQTIESKDLTTPNTFIVNFIRYYVSYCYNYDISSFDYNINKCSDLMSQNLWNEKQDSIERAIRELKENKVQYSSYIEKIEMKSEGEFIALIVSNKNESGSISNVKVKLHLIIKEILRSKNNPWGFEVDNVTEELI